MEKPHVGGGSENRMWSPNTSKIGFQNKYTKVCKRARTRNPRKSVLASKVVNPFTCALKPRFVGRRRDFYIPRLPSNLKNIPSVNMYKNVFYIPWFAELISHIYMPSTRSHFEPRLLRPHLWLSLPSIWLFIHESRQSPGSPNWVCAFTAEVKFFNISEVSIAIISRTCQVPTVLK
jgi:hypothetical protein